MKPNVVQRVIAVAGENFDSRGCRVTNPYITARESIELGDYIVALEEENKKLNSRLVAITRAIEVIQDLNPSKTSLANTTLDGAIEKDQMERKLWHKLNEVLLNKSESV